MSVEALSHVTGISLPGLDHAKKLARPVAVYTAAALAIVGGSTLLGQHIAYRLAKADMAENKSILACADHKYLALVTPGTITPYSGFDEKTPGQALMIYDRKSGTLTYDREAPKFDLAYINQLAACARSKGLKADLVPATGLQP